MIRFVSALATSLLLSTGLAAAGVDESPEVVVADFHTALAAGEREAALARLDPDVLIFESGGAELSRDEYAAHHFGADMAFSAATQRTIVDQQSGEIGDSAWVLTQSKTTGTFREKAIDSRGTETMLLRRGTDGWRIIHIHWSSR
jgi:ketosteroid isomerase-like protein